MSILVVGVNHRTAPLSVLERLTLTGDEISKTVAGLAARDNLREVVVLSTCNRTEVYAVTERFHGAYADISDHLCTVSGLHADELTPHLYSEHDDAAVSHLFEVAAGLDSVVVGEGEILGQVRDAWEVARTEGGARTSANLMFRLALEVGKRARTETAIARGTASISHAAVEMVAERLGDLAGRRVLVVGAGSMGEGITVALDAAGAESVTVLNRDISRADRVATRVGGQAAGLDALRTHLADADVVLTCTGADGTLIDVDMVTAVREPGRPVVFVDIAVPRDVDARVATLPDTVVLDLDDLSAWADRGRAERLAETDDVRRLVAEQVDRFAAELTAMQAAPLVAAMRERAEEVRIAEVDRFASRLDGLTADQRAAVDALTKGIVNKLLHEPSVRLRSQAGTPQGERNAAAVADLFDIE
ncbi:MAG: glutamyl-tRNA reductase [Ilumatobacteraceae bacterium]